MKLSTPEQLVATMKTLTMPAKEKMALNRKLANMARKYFRAQIREQRDVLTDKAYLPRKRGKIDGWTGQRFNFKTLDGKRTSAMASKRARLMFSGISRELRAYPEQDGFRVGLEGLMGKIGMVHNEGGMVEFSYRMHGFFNSKTKKWQGGQKQTGYYEMPERPFLGWNDELIRQLENEILSHMGASLA